MSKTRSCTVSYPSVKAQKDRLLEPPASGRNRGRHFCGEEHGTTRPGRSQLTLQVEALNRGHDEDADIAIKAFELSQSLTSKWVTADYAAKRRILEIICLNWTLDDVTLCPH